MRMAVVGHIEWIRFARLRQVPPPGGIEHATETWEGAGGRTVGTTGDGKTSLGELKVGKGRVRIIGSLLPNPSGDYAHPFGVADYALTYVGYILFDNAVGARASLLAS